MTQLPRDHEPNSRIKSTRISKYNAKRSNLFIHDLTNLPYDHEPYSSNKSTRIPKYNAKRSI
ncbi:uncharacterized protein G2W53_015252 [Senna tora]|uniref:Uncharacterized protein n=1 Tax=Senna tora TaxID=362788 RepID=A0A835C5C0_9FABA|nr:uncharacterized protein G2W53_015252 [Senna tora]